MNEAVLKLLKEKTETAELAALEARAIANGYRDLLLEQHSNAIRAAIRKALDLCGFFEIKGTEHDGVYEFTTYGKVTELDDQLNPWFYVAKVKWTKAKTRQKYVEKQGFNLAFLLKNAKLCKLTKPGGKLKPAVKNTPLES